MQRGLIKQLTLTVSCAALVLALGAATVRAQDAMPPPMTGGTMPMDNSAAMPMSNNGVTDPMASGDAGAPVANVAPKGDGAQVDHALAGDATKSSMGSSGSVAPAEVPGGNATNAVQVASSSQKKWTTLTLPQAVGIGVATYPEHGIVANNRRATDEELRQARSLYLPSIDARADGGYEHSHNPTLQSVSGGDSSENLWRYNTGITLTQMLFDGFSARYENLRQEARVLSIAHRVREAAELQGLAVVESYLEVMRQRELLQIARDNVAQHMTISDQIRDSTQSGKTTEADTQQSQARLASARAEEENTRESLRIAEADYIRDVGMEPEDLIMPATPSDQLEKDVEQEVKITLAQSPTIAIFQADTKVAHAELQGTHSTMYPKFDFQLQGQDGHNTNGLPGRNIDESALVVMNWNLYRGGGDLHRTREYIAREAQAKEERAKAARGVEDDVRKTWASMVSSGERAKEFAAQAGANSQVVKAYKDQFDLARRTLLDVLDAQNELFVSRGNAVNAQFLEMFAVYRLLALKGELLHTLNVPVPREADAKNM